MNKLLPLYMLLLFCSCKNNSINQEQVKREILSTDRRFSALSAEKGMKQAFLEYLDTAGVLLRPNNYPIEGMYAKIFLKSIKDNSFSMTWEPNAADVASSGDLGFTYGIYTLKTKDTLRKGTYVTIWKLQKDGSWKFVLDSGNPGLEPGK